METSVRRKLSENLKRVRERIAAACDRGEIGTRRSGWWR